MKRIALVVVAIHFFVVVLQYRLSARVVRQPVFGVQESPAFCVVVVQTFVA